MHGLRVLAAAPASAAAASAVGPEAVDLRAAAAAGSREGGGVLAPLPAPGAAAAAAHPLSTAGAAALLGALQRGERLADGQLRHLAGLAADAARGRVHPSPALAGALAVQLADAAQWPALESLLAAGALPSLAACPALLPALAARAQYGTMALACLKCRDIPASSVVAALTSVLDASACGGGADAAAAAGPSSSKAAAAAAGGGGAAAAAATPAAQAAALASYRARLMSAAEATVARAEASGGAEEGALALAKCAAAAVDGFGARELPLHALLFVAVDGSEAQAALRRLPPPHVRRLLRYLGKWVDAYTGRLGDGAAGVALPDELAFPTLGQVLEWARALLDAQLARLAMQGDCTELLARMRGALRGYAEASAPLLSLRGAAEHLQRGAALPAAHVAAASAYTVELLDLRVT